MSNDIFNWDNWKNELEGVWRNIPKHFRAGPSIGRTLQCHLYGKLEKLGLRPVADYKPPRVTDRPVDLIGVDEAGKVVCAICFDTLVSLYAVKSLDSFDADHKVIFTTGHLEKKVMESRFFLKPDIDHVHLKPFGDR